MNNFSGFFFEKLRVDRYCQKEGVAPPNEDCRYECLSFIDYTAGGIKAAGLSIGLEIGTGEAVMILILKSGMNREVHVPFCERVGK